jgi:SsrA-binding protein
MKQLVKNRKATFNYEILEVYEAGISLLGSEVKSILIGNVSLDEGWITIKNNEVWLKQVHIQKYKNATRFDSEISETRDRRLLLHKAEIRKIEKQSREKTMAIIPLDIHYSNTKKIKLTIAVCRGKKLYDKRHDIKEKDIQREINRGAKQK